MLETVGQVLTQAAAILVSPIPIIIVILMLISERGKVTAPAFVAGWMVGVAAITTVALVLADGADAASDDDTRTGIDGIQLALGLLFVFLAIKTWRSRPRGGEVAEPKIFSIIDSLSWIKAAGTGLAFASIAAPKNLALEVGSGVTIAKDGLSASGDVGAVIIFTVVASLAVLVPLVAVLVLGPRVAAPLADVREWLITHDTAIMLVLFILLAAHFIGDGLGLFT